MPKIYVYLGIVILFYSNEHEPVHIHGKHQEGNQRLNLLLKTEK